jgi:hypothetical protein
MEIDSSIFLGSEDQPEGCLPNKPSREAEGAECAGVPRIQRAARLWRHQCYVPGGAQDIRMRLMNLDKSSLSAGRSLFIASRLDFSSPSGDFAEGIIQRLYGRRPKFGGYLRQQRRMLGVPFLDLLGNSAVH